MSGGSSPRPSVRREFFGRVLPVTIGLLMAGVVASYLQHGFLIGGTAGVPLAGPGCHPALMHLLALGFFAGYSMALVGGAGGLVSLPYNMSVLHFVTPHVSPTVQLETFLNPFGALLGFRRQGQASRDFATPLCAGAVVGALIGPFIRLFALDNPTPFKAVVGCALLFVGGRMLRRVASRSAQPSVAPRSATAEPVRIRTLERTWRTLHLEFDGESRRLFVPGLVAVGGFVGIVATILGVGGGFLLVPILAEFYRLPMRVIVAASIPFVIVLSAVGLFTFNVGLPLLTGHRLETEWAWGFFTGASAFLGAWCATHSQRHIPERALRLLLGSCSAIVGLLYVLAYLGVSPVRM